jgi:hypothetical protein
MSNHLLSVTKTKYGVGHIPIAQSVLAHCFKHLISFPKTTLFIIGPLL